MQVNIISKTKRENYKTIPQTFIATEKDCIYSICKLIYGNFENLTNLEKLNNKSRLEALNDGEVILLAANSV
jgi:hypothetical protein